MTNGERADRLFSEAFGVAEEMRRSLQQESWNLAFRRARSPAFYQEIVVSDAEARDAVDGAERVLAFGRDLLARLRRP